MNLVIDIGNTMHKMALFDKGQDPIVCIIKPLLQLSDLEQIFREYFIENAILSSVGICNENIIHFLQSHCHYISYTSSVKLPIIIGYNTPHTLGMDRIANAVGAVALFPQSSVLSIQAGSCLVFDFVDSRGVYRGGSISPGIEMRFKALQTYTKGLPRETRTEIDYYIGTNTQQSIRSGVINGIIDEIDGMINRYKTDFNPINVLLTGGDMSYLQNSIKNTIFAAPNLVFQGLNKILKMNV